MYLEIALAQGESSPAIKQLTRIKERQISKQIQSSLAYLKEAKPELGLEDIP